jgi:hypothetical protein
MAIHKWSDLKHRKYAKDPKRLERIEREVEKEVLELNLKAMRELLGKTQVETAKAAKMSQGEVSRAESREDHLLSTLRRYVKALGGDVEVVALFGDKRIRLRGV